MTNLHNWQWQTDKRWLCRDCGEYSNCICAPTDPGPYHKSNCPRSTEISELLELVDIQLSGKVYQVKETGK